MKLSVRPLYSSLRERLSLLSVSVLVCLLLLLGVAWCVPRLSFGVGTVLGPGWAGRRLSATNKRGLAPRTRRPKRLAQGEPRGVSPPETLVLAVAVSGKQGSRLPSGNRPDRSFPSLRRSGSGKGQKTWEGAGRTRGRPSVSPTKGSRAETTDTPQGNPRAVRRDGHASPLDPDEVGADCRGEEEGSFTLTSLNLLVSNCPLTFRPGISWCGSSCPLVPRTTPDPPQGGPRPRGRVPR